MIKIILYIILLTMFFISCNNVLAEKLDNNFTLNIKNKNDSNDDNLCEGNNIWKHTPATKDTDEILLPSKENYCTVKEYFDDSFSADMAHTNAIKRFSEEAARKALEYCGVGIANISKIENGKLVDDVILAAYMNHAHPNYDKLIERGFDMTKKLWWIKVDLNAKIKCLEWAKVVQDFVETVTKNEQEKQYLMDEVMYYKSYKKLYHMKERELSELLKKHKEYKEQIKWNSFYKNSGKMSIEEQEEELKNLTSSSNPIVIAKSRKRKAQLYINKNRLLEAINAIHEYLNATKEREPVLLNKLGMAYWIAHNNLGKAEDIFKEALKEKPKNELQRNITYNLATVLGLQGKHTEGIKELNKLKKLDKDGLVLRATLTSRNSLVLICKDLCNACKSGNCKNWNRALQKGDCFEKGDCSKNATPPIDEDIMKKNLPGVFNDH
jgi:tetratricopeptide (TPR) repeat protein